MIAITVPTTDVNSETAVVVEWHAADRTAVNAGEALAQVETSKAILEVSAPESGILLQLFAVGDQVQIAEPIGYVFETADALERYVRDRATPDPVAGGVSEARVTLPARRRAQELGIDVNELARGT